MEEGETMREDVGEGVGDENDEREGAQMSLS